MKLYRMTDEYRKILTELLGECWNEVYSKDKISLFTHRTFTTDTDMLAVFRAIRDKGKWEHFESFVMLHWCDRENQKIGFTEWLFLEDYERAYMLAAEFWKEAR